MTTDPNDSVSAEMCFDALIAYHATHKETLEAMMVDVAAAADLGRFSLEVDFEGLPWEGLRSFWRDQGFSAIVMPSVGAAHKGTLRLCWAL